MLHVCSSLLPSSVALVGVPDGGFFLDLPSALASDNGTFLYRRDYTFHLTVSAANENTCIVGSCTTVARSVAYYRIVVLTCH